MQSGSTQAGRQVVTRSRFSRIRDGRSLGSPERADAVLAGNDILADWLSRHSDRVQVIPSLVDPRTVAIREHTDRPAVVWGWIGSRSTAMHLHALVDVLESATRQLPDRNVEVLVVGGPAPAIPGARVRELAWSEAVETEALARIDVGLMPLPDTPWTRGKCSYKALQYMSAGIPVVADDVGVSAKVVGNGAGGLIVGQRDDWVDALVRLSRDVSLRRSLGEEGRRRVASEFSVERWAPRSRPRCAATSRARASESGRPGSRRRSRCQRCGLRSGGGRGSRCTRRRRARPDDRQAAGRVEGATPSPHALPLWWGCACEDG